ncbi:hypothetical protein GCM10010082_27460 [Kushneria pakistanensis]|uniref:Uncharacterized protein n=1 Tax=Kushneria pakistanensis TaxID=1508770 RepID=A0ABQ3FNH1_9GAMM|nr:hypothetical protein GCM10010082_27460 [Kushneria pakistanensis]
MLKDTRLTKAFDQIGAKGRSADHYRAHERLLASPGVETVPAGLAPETTVGEILTSPFSVVESREDGVAGKVVAGRRLAVPLIGASKGWWQKGLL